VLLMWYFDNSRRNWKRSFHLQTRPEIEKKRNIHSSSDNFWSAFCVFHAHFWKKNAQFQNSFYFDKMHTSMLYNQNISCVKLCQKHCFKNPLFSKKKTHCFPTCALSYPIVLKRKIITAFIIAFVCHSPWNCPKVRQISTKSS